MGSQNQTTQLSHSPVKIEKERLNGKKLLIKVGGNALTSTLVADQIAEQIAILIRFGASVVLVHGGGIEINTLLKLHSIESEFVDGHRKTDKESMTVIEMALSGKVNKQLVESLQKNGVNAVGISGRDGRLVTAGKRFHTYREEGIDKTSDLGLVGDVSEVNPELIRLLLDHQFTPVVSPVSASEDGEALNVNADMFAGHLAASLEADHFIAMSNIDGLMKDPAEPDSVIPHLTKKEAEGLPKRIIQGGMIPKIESCLKALDHPNCVAHIVNGTKDQQLLRIFEQGSKIGTTITHSR